MKVYKGDEMNIKIEKIPEGKLSPTQRTHLEVARKVAGRVPVVPAKLSNHLHIIGVYSTWGRNIYIAPERLDRLNTTINTTIHEKSHAITLADDGTPQHEKVMADLSREVANRALKGEFDQYLAEARW